MAHGCCARGGSVGYNGCLLWLRGPFGMPTNVTSFALCQCRASTLLWTVLTAGRKALRFRDRFLLFLQVFLEGGWRGRAHVRPYRPGSTVFL